jgi:hypothetical protein
MNYGCPIRLMVDNTRNDIERSEPNYNGRAARLVSLDPTTFIVLVTCNDHLDFTFSFFSFFFWHDTRE